MTFAGWLAVALVAVGTCLIGAQLVVENIFLAASATCLLGVGATLTAFKAHRSAVGSARLLNEHRRDAARTRALLAEVLRVVEDSQALLEAQPALVQRESGTQPPPVQSDFHPQSPPVQAEPRTSKPDAQAESRDQEPADPARKVGAAIGAIEASSVKTVDRGIKGRQAAAVTGDDARPSKLFSATLGMGSSVLKQDRLNRRPIAGIVSPELLGVLEGKYAFTQFRPGLIPVELEYSQPSALVLEESACDVGVWFGALRTTGASLFSDILGALTWAKSKHQSIFILPDPSPKPYTAVLRRHGTYLVQPGFVPPNVERDVSLPLLESLLEYISRPGIESKQCTSDARLAS